MSLKRHREMEFGIHEAAHEKIGVAFESQNFKLHEMHQAVKQAALGNFLVEDHNVEEGQGVHVCDLGQVDETQGPIFVVERRIGDALERSRVGAVIPNLQTPS